MRRSACAAVLAIALSGSTAAACTASTGSGAQTPAGPTSTPPSTPTKSATVTRSSTAKPSPSKKAKPLSPYEKDPAVQALRAWAAQVARTINTGKYDGANLKALMTAGVAKSMKTIAGTEVGHRYPGPLPFTPLGVRVNNARSRDMKICIVSDGFSVRPKTGKVFAKYHKQAINAGAVLSRGRWLVSKFELAGFSCANVRIPEKTW